MAQEEKKNHKPATCVECGQPTNYPIELNENLYCSSKCLSTYRQKVGEQRFQKESIATFDKKRSTGWIPERAIMYIEWCRSCNKNLREMCKSNQYICGLHRDALRRTETVPWCCHARFNLSSSLADRTVTLEAAQKIQALAEELVKNPKMCEELIGPESLRKKMAKAEGLKGVTTTIIDLAAGEMARNFESKTIDEKTPKEDGDIMIHYAACLECDPVFGAECEEQAVEKDLNNCVDAVRKMTHSLWCEHTLQALSAILLNKKMTTERLQKIIASAEHIARVNNDPGLNTRHLFVALGRAV